MKLSQSLMEFEACDEVGPEYVGVPFVLEDWDPEIEGRIGACARCVFRQPGEPYDSSATKECELARTCEPGGCESRRPFPHYIRKPAAVAAPEAMV